MIHFLEKDAAVQEFLNETRNLVIQAVDHHRRRGFTDLTVGFGCTGGQHRSVYLAEQVAKRLRGRPGIEVVVHHRELARMEAEIAIGTLLWRFPNLRLATNRVRWRSGITFRGVDSLPLCW